MKLKAFVEDEICDCVGKLEGYLSNMSRVQEIEVTTVAVKLRFMYKVSTKIVPMDLQWMPVLLAFQITIFSLRRF